MMTVLDPPCFQAISNPAMSMTCMGKTDLKCYATFRGDRDFGGLTWWSEDVHDFYDLGSNKNKKEYMHKNARYKTVRNYSNINWSFLYTMDGHYFEDYFQGYAAALTIRLEAPYTPPPVKLPNGESVSLSAVNDMYAYVGQFVPPAERPNPPNPIQITVDFENLKEHRWFNYKETIPNPDTTPGAPPTITQEQSYEVDIKIPVTNVNSVMFPILSRDFRGDEKKNLYTGNHMDASFFFTNWKVQNSPNVENTVGALSKSGLSWAEGIPDESYRNPQRLIDVMTRLGYMYPTDESDIPTMLTLYTGTGDQCEFWGEKGTPALNEVNQATTHLTSWVEREGKLNRPIAEWIRYLIINLPPVCKLTLSVAMEFIRMPKEWRQIGYKLEGGAQVPFEGGTGWNPPTNFISPTNEEAMEFYLNLLREMIELAPEKLYAVQLGECWWWWQGFQPGNVDLPFPGNPPCFYDVTTVAKAIDDGIPLPIVTDSMIDLPEETLIWLNKEIMKFSERVHACVKEYSTIKYTVLFFPPSVIDKSYVPHNIQVVNYMNEIWKYPQIDFFQIEDYDWLILDNPMHKDVYAFSYNELDFPPTKVDYFVGFAWDRYKWPSGGTLSSKSATINMSTTTAVPSLSAASGVAYYTINASSSSRFREIILDTNTFTLGDTIFIKNNRSSNQSLTIKYLDKAGKLQTFSPKLDPGKTRRFGYNGISSNVPWSYVSVVGFDDKKRVGYVTVVAGNTAPMPIEEQWKRINKAVYDAKRYGIGHVTVWAGSQIRRDDYIPDFSGFDRIRGFEYYIKHEGELFPAKMYIKLGGNMYTTTPYIRW